MAETISAMNPPPIRLKFEKVCSHLLHCASTNYSAFHKVYLPCVLLAKKRYVGFKYENPDDTEPVFDAKGIETVRRDGCAAQSKMIEMCLQYEVSSYLCGYTVDPHTGFYSAHKILVLSKNTAASFGPES